MQINIMQCFSNLNCCSSRYDLVYEHDDDEPTPKSKDLNTPHKDRSKQKKASQRNDDRYNGNHKVKWNMVIF